MKPSEFGIALRNAREAAEFSQAEVARVVEKTPITVHRWELYQVRPTYEDRVALLRLFSDAPRPLLVELARCSSIDLNTVLPPPPPPPPPVAATPPPPAKVMDANAQAVLDDAVREAAEDLDVSPRAFRPILSRLIDRAARAGVPMDAAARMVLGVPKKKESVEKKKPALPAD